MWSGRAWCIVSFTVPRGFLCSHSRYEGMHNRNCHPFFHCYFVDLVSIYQRVFTACKRSWETVNVFKGVCPSVILSMWRVGGLVHHMHQGICHMVGSSPPPHPRHETRTVGKWAVRILWECCLVLLCINVTFYLLAFYDFYGAFHTISYATVSYLYMTEMICVCFKSFTLFIYSQCCCCDYIIGIPHRKMINKDKTHFITYTNHIVNGTS